MSVPPFDPRADAGARRNAYRIHNRTPAGFVNTKIADADEDRLMSPRSDRQSFWCRHDRLRYDDRHPEALSLRAVLKMGPTTSSTA
jgi:hypothetical protein